jgi:hypothetical protein
VDNILQRIWQQIADVGLHAVLEAILTGVLALVTALLVRSLVRRGKVWIGTDAGRTSISPLVLMFSVLSAVIAVVALAAGLVFRHTLSEPGDFYAWVGWSASCRLPRWSCWRRRATPGSGTPWACDGMAPGRARRCAGPIWCASARWRTDSCSSSMRGGRSHARRAIPLEHGALLRAVRTARPDLAACVVRRGSVRTSLNRSRCIAASLS